MKHYVVCMMDEGGKLEQAKGCGVCATRKVAHNVVGRMVSQGDTREFFIAKMGIVAVRQVAFTSTETEREDLVDKE